MFCHKCGYQNQENSRFCIRCGEQIQTNEDRKRKLILKIIFEKRANTALILGMTTISISILCFLYPYINIFICLITGTIAITYSITSLRKSKTKAIWGLILAVLGILISIMVAILPYAI